MNCILGAKEQNAWIDAAEATRLLAGTQRAALWAELSGAEQEQAILDVTPDVQTLTWRGKAIFEDQPWALPTDQLGGIFSVTAERGSTENVLPLAAAASLLTTDMAGGAAHLIGPTDDEEYRGAAAILAFDRSASRLRLGKGFRTPLAGKSLLLLAPLPIAVRRALAFQAVDRGAVRRHRDLADAVHRGVESFGEGIAARDRAGRMLWSVDAYWLVAPYLERGLRIERG
ncbi:MAG: hypothetical protein GX444_08240 [Myxococcales bacterium]|nr:hypothetical protein [Myxococcales bacterium]